MNKSTVEEIKERFDNDVERFSNLDTGQLSTIDAKVSLELITEASKKWSMPIHHWRQAMVRFIIEFGDRLEKHIN